MRKKLFQSLSQCYFILVLITWFCYFSYCGWLLKREGKSLDYEFWTLLFKSIVKACIAFALIENELPGTVGLGIEFTICLSIINSLVTTLYPMIDMYKFVRKSLVTTPVKSMEFQKNNKKLILCEVTPKFKTNLGVTSFGENGALQIFS